MPAKPTRSVTESIGRIEIAAGVILFVYATLSPMISRFYPFLEPDVMFGLWPLTLLFTGFGLVVAGGRLIKAPRWPWAWHLPLVAWVIFSVFILL
jgi:hypothetical protein